MTKFVTCAGAHSRTLAARAHSHGTSVTSQVRCSLKSLFTESAAVAGAAAVQTVPASRPGNTAAALHLAAADATDSTTAILCTAGRRPGKMHNGQWAWRIFEGSYADFPFSKQGPDLVSLAELCQSSTVELAAAFAAQRLCLRPPGASAVSYQLCNSRPAGGSVRSSLFGQKKVLQLQPGRSQHCLKLFTAGNMPQTFPASHCMVLHSTLALLYEEFPRRLVENSPDCPGGSFSRHTGLDI